MSQRFLFTSESVTEGHPDKLCDQISDAVLDALLAQDKNSRVAVETMAGTGFIHLAGEVSTSGTINYADVAREVVKNIGYTHTDHGFDAATCAVHTSVGTQSPDISQGVSEGQGLFAEQGAGDQGLMFGYACNENDEYMPMPIHLAHALTRNLSELRKSGELDYLRPDGKSQVTIRYENNKPVAVDAVVVSTQHADHIDHKQIVNDLTDKLIKPLIPQHLDAKKMKLYINPTGRFVIGGPMGDCGLTGRKIIVDTYGGWGRHGGGAFSGKDPSKVDRSAAYMARYVAKNVVAAGLASHCEVQLAYAIGVAEPVSIMINTFETSKIDEQKIAEVLQELCSFKPKSIIEQLSLLETKFLPTASYGHFGRGKDGFPWEQLTLVEDLKAKLL